jgi:hypothetical protein
MSKWSETIEHHRTALLAVIMGALLLLCVALAGWLVAARGGARQEGTDVLGVIREKKLPALWGNEGINLWYLWADPNGKPVGWWTRTRSPAARGYYKGKRIEQVGPLFLREVWQVDRAGRASQYLARTSAVVRQPGTRIPLLRQVSTTSILLRDGQVEVRRTGTQVGQLAKAAAPSNYIPEGLNDLAYYLASLGERRATFTLVNNETAIVRGRLNFARITAVPDGRGKVILSVQPPEGDQKESMEFDSKGEVLRGGNPASGFSFERSTFDVVKKTFPDVELFLRREAEEAPED